MVAKLLLAVTLGCSTTGCKPLADCGTPKLVNQTIFPWNDRDFENMHRAQISCGFKYKGCLKTWTKVSQLNYHAICGARGE